MMRTSLLIAVLVTGAAAPAAADGFVELEAGLAFPQSDDAYKDLIGTSVAYAMRTGLLVHSRPLQSAPTIRWVGGLELGVGLSSLYHTSEDEGAPSFTRYRAIAGLRGGMQTADWLLHVRAGAGIDVVHMESDGILEGLCGDPTVLGMAAEAAIAGYRRFGRLFIGGQVSVVAGFHDGDRPVCRSIANTPVNIDVLDYTAVDGTLSLVVGASL